MTHRNKIGQSVKVRRLSPLEKEVLINSVESAMNGPFEEGRIFWTDDRKHVSFAPIAIGDKSRLAS